MSDDLYFEPPSRLQLVDKLAHLMRFSNAFVVLSGPEGTGLTTIFQQLSAQLLEDDSHFLSFSLSANTNLGETLRLLNEQVDKFITSTETNSNDQLTILHRKVERFAQSHQKIVVFIDNADLLSDDAIECLANLQMSNANYVAVLLTGPESLVKRVNTITDNGNLLANYHVEIPPPFNRLETEEYISQFFVRGSDFSNKQLSDIFNKSKGYPGKISELTTEMIKVGKIGFNVKKRLLPLPHLVGIGVLVLAIILASSWQIFNDTEQADDVAGFNEESRELTLNLQTADSTFTDDGYSVDSEATNSLDEQIAELTAQIDEHKQDRNQLTAQAVELLDDQLLQEESTDTENASVLEGEGEQLDVAKDATGTIGDLNDIVLSDNLKDELLIDQEDNIDNKLRALNSSIKENIDEEMLVSVSSELHVENDSTTNVKSDLNGNLSSPAKTQEELPNTVNAPDVTSAKRLASAAAIKQWPARGYTLQLLGANSENSVAKFLSSTSEAEKMYLYQTQLNGKPWNVIVYGQYANRSNATSAIAKLPIELQQLKPWVKSIKSVKSAIK